MLLGCSTKVDLSLNILSDLLVKEYSLIDIKTNDPLVGKPGYYIDKKVLEGESFGRLEIELFDNENDLLNRINYIEGYNTRIRDTIFKDNVELTGGQKNAVFLSSVFEKYLDEPLIERYDNFIIKYYDLSPSRFNEFVNSAINSYDTNFKNDFDSDGYNVQELIDAEFTSFDIKKELTDAFENLILKDENLTTLYEQIKEKDAQEVIDIYQNEVENSHILRVPFIRDLYDNDVNFIDLRNLFNDSKSIVAAEEKKEAERKEAERKESERKEAEEKKNSEKELLVTYMKELEDIFNKNDSSSIYTVVEDKGFSPSEILIEQTIIDEDLMIALLSNVTYGLFQDETRYFITNLRSTLKTMDRSNPTGKNITFVILDPRDDTKTKALYYHTEGSEFVNKFIFGN